MNNGIRLLPLLLFTSCFFHHLPAQSQFNFWYFGQGAGIDFNSGTPVALSGGMLYSNEGTASIADEVTGNLLFYTDGVTVYNRIHTVMPNGTALSGDVTTTQSALIVRQPGSDSLYYVFTVPPDDGLTDLRYSVVDMSQLSGLGDVTVKNIFLAAGSGISEKATAIHHCNGSDWWIIFHGRGNNSYQSWLLDAAGLSASPVASSVGTVITTDLNRGVGWMASSEDAKQIAMASYSGGTVDIVDFDNENGIMSDHLVLTGFTKPYGLAFSPNDTILYVTDDMSLVQFDLSSGDSATISASRNAVITEANMMRAIRLGPDHKMYIAREWEPYLGVVNNPDMMGAGCSYVSAGFYLSPGSNALGLPNTYSLVAPQCPLRVSEGRKPEAIQVFPQPASSVLYIEFVEERGEEAELSLLDLNGREVIGKASIITESPGKYILLVESLPQGLYILQVTTGSRKVRKSVSIQ
jgi:hypothetical protein